MTNAAQIAREALLEEERPKREKEEQERKVVQRQERAKANRLRSDANMRFEQSPIQDWFPGVVWQFVERDRDGVLLYGNKPIPGFFDVWQSGEDREYDMVRLLWHENRNVYFDKHKGYSHERNRDQWNCLVQVNSAADVARALRDYEQRTRDFGQC